MIHLLLGASSANPNAWQSMGKRFSGENLKLQTEDIVSGLIVIAVFVIGFLILQWLGNKQKGTKRHSTNDLFRELCEAHGLERRERKTLTSIARVLNIKDRTGLFVRPDLFEHKLVLETVGEGPCQSLKSRLFD